MRRLRQSARLWLHSQLLPVVETAEDPLIGGQAVMEGVMMRTPTAYSVAVRMPDGDIVTKEAMAPRLSDKSRFWKLPVIRGCGVLGQSLGLGMKALNFSSKMAIEAETGGDDQNQAEPSAWLMAINIAISVGFFILMYKFLPLVLTTQLQAWSPSLENQAAFSLVEGGIRLAIFLAFLFAISRLADIRRVFEYHGAEHKVVFNYESGQEVGVRAAQGFETWHPRCGTSFQMVVMILAIAIYALVPFEGFMGQFVARIALLPLIAGLSYEIIRFSAKHGGSVFALMVRPGLWLQRITTQPPDDSQIEVSIHALRTALDFEKRSGGEPVVA